MLRIWLVRHTESLSNSGEVTDLPHTIPLSARGKTQAAELAAAFPVRPDRIIVSRYRRTLDTAAPLLARFPDCPVSEWDAHEFTFLAPERYRGTTLAQRRSPASAYWEKCDPDHRDGEGADTFRSFMERVRGFIQRLRSQPERFIAAIIHGYFIKGIIWQTLYRGDPVSVESMTGFRALHHYLPVLNGSIFPACFDASGRLFIGSPWNAPYTDPPPDHASRP